ncbi:aspartate kinase [Thermococcus alcaliphilus]|uniref:aspartate kinase n=1 Tax=Thermococcus alcaliphilus TaxID=139207 RepID=UPI00209145EF|nr:aspartate kinase [Thermococcus alcaliphilus]
MIYKLSRIVVKFGGSSIRNSFEDALELVQKFWEEKSEVVVVLSALKGVTDLLLELAERKSPELLEEFTNIHLATAEKFGVNIDIEEELKELRFVLKNERAFPSKKAYTDHVFSFGERLSVKLFSSTLNERGIESAPIDAFYLIETNGNFGNAEVNLEKTKNNLWMLEELLKAGKVPVVTGFLGKFNSLRTTLGRGGSDYTASVLGRLLNARAVLIMSDVKGIYTANPRIVKNAKVIPFVSYDEALIASKLGLKALHERAIEPVKNRVPLIFGRTNKWRLGTLVSNFTLKIPLITYKIIGEKAKIGVIGASCSVPYPVVEQKEEYTCFIVDRVELEEVLNEIHEVIFGESSSSSNNSELWAGI